MIIRTIFKKRPQPNLLAAWPGVPVFFLYTRCIRLAICSVHMLQVTAMSANNGASVHLTHEWEPKGLPDWKCLKIRLSIPFTMCGPLFNHLEMEQAVIPKMCQTSGFMVRGSYHSMAGTSLSKTRFEFVSLVFTNFLVILRLLFALCLPRICSGYEL